VRTKYENIIEVFEVIDEFSTICAQCDNELEENHFQIHFRPTRTGARLVIPICEYCMPVNSKAVRKIVVEYLEEDAEEYSLVI